MRKKKFEPLKLNLNSLEDIFETRKKEVSIAILKAIEYAEPKGIKTVDFAELNFANTMSVRLALNLSDFPQLIDKNIQILEEFEEYEWCAKGVKLKEKFIKRGLVKS